MLTVLFATCFVGLNGCGLIGDGEISEDEFIDYYMKTMPKLKEQAEVEVEVEVQAEVEVEVQAEVQAEVEVEVEVQQPASPAAPAEGEELQHISSEYLSNEAKAKMEAELAKMSDADKALVRTENDFILFKLFSHYAGESSSRPCLFLTVS